MKLSIRKRLAASIIVATALLAATVAVPQQAKADATLATALAGTALLGLFLHKQQPITQTYPQAYVSYAAPQAYYATSHAPAQAAAPAYSSYAPVVYMSVVPTNSTAPAYYIAR